MHAADSAFLVIDGIVMVLMLVPFMAHMRAWNAATCWMMFYVMLGSLNRFINTAIWHDSVEDYAPVWCDISTKIQIGLSLGLPLATMTINRRLASLRKASASPHPNARRHEALIDSLICGLPVLIFMAIHYTMQGHRYEIIESFGCWAATYLTEPALVLVFLPPIIVSLISAFYACLSIHFFWQRHQEFESFLRNSSNSMSRSTYVRLMLLGSVEIIITVPLSIVFLAWSVARNGVSHWISWEDTKWGFSRHETYTRFMLEYAGGWVIGSYETSRWVFVFCGLLFFAFFGFSKEVVRSYYDIVATVSYKIFNKRMPSWEERQLNKSRSSSTPKPRTFSLFGRTIAIYSPAAWKKQSGEATTTTLNNSVSVVLPQHMGDMSGTRKYRRDSFGFSIVSHDGICDEVGAKRDSGYDFASPTASGSSMNEKEMDDFLADLPVLDASALDALPVLATAHTRSPSRASENLSIRVDVERSQSHV